MRPTNIIEIDFFSLKRPLSETPPPITETMTAPVTRGEAFLVRPIPRQAPSIDWSTFKVMNSRYSGKCRDSGRTFEEGDVILWNSDNKTVYRPGSDTFTAYIKYLTEVI